MVIWWSWSTAENKHSIASLKYLWSSKTYIYLSSPLILLVVNGKCLVIYWEKASQIIRTRNALAIPFKLGYIIIQKLLIHGFASFYSKIYASLINANPTCLFYPHIDENSERRHSLNSFIQWLDLPVPSLDNNIYMIYSTIFVAVIDKIMKMKMRGTHAEARLC